MNVQSDFAFKSWAKFLDPDSLKSNLISASLFIAAFEVLQSSVMDPLKGFFSLGFDVTGVQISPKYGTEVLSRHKSPFRASLLWFRESGAIDDLDLELVDKIRDHRNELAHQLPKYIATVGAEINLQLLQSTCDFVAKIDRWWIKEIEMPTDPDMTPERLDATNESDITSGNMMFLQMMTKIAAGDDSAADDILKQISAAFHDFDCDCDSRH